MSERVESAEAPPICGCRPGSICWFHAIPTERDGRPLVPEWRTIKLTERGGRCGRSCHGGDGLHLYRRKDKTDSACWDCAVEKGVFGRPPIERCSCPESLVLREELASAAAHIATLLEHLCPPGEFSVAESARQWLETHKERLP